MKITFSGNKVERQFSSKYKKTWKYPKQVQIKLEAIETFIIGAASFLDIANYPPYHLERLKGDRKNEWSIRVGNTGYRVVFYPCDEKGDKMVYGDILAEAKSIRIIRVTEVSNHYE